MSLAPGTRLGPYEVTALIGEGGMGKVWRAHHTALKRDDALKVLPDAFASDPERLARFRREAQVLASLNHPNIAHVYGLEQVAGVQALVMELVEGPTLADRIAKGVIPIDEALPIAKQIAEALEAAHEQDIIHRDLKPANIKVRRDGTVKVLDFGLAKALEPVSAAGVDTTASPTITSPAMMTGVGMLLGTAAYMSPEQARGRPVDKRADIWAFGCVFYEMLTGRRAFDGHDVPDTLAAVLRGEPDWSRLPANTHAAVGRLLRRCLQKDARERLHDISDARIEIQDAKAEVTSAGTATSVPLVTGRRKRLAWVTAATAIVVAAAIAAGVTIWNSPEVTVSPAISRFVIPLSSEGVLRSAGALVVAISPDGRRIVYRDAGASGLLYMRSLDSPELKPISGTQGGTDPFWSPDGQWLGFTVGPGRLMKVPLGGGPPITLCECGADVGATWAPDNTIIFGTRTAAGEGRGLFQIPAAGGTPTALTKPDPNKSTLHAWPDVLPGRNVVLFANAENNNWDNAQILAFHLDSREQKVLIQGGGYPKYTPTGHLVYYRAGTVMAVPFDPDNLEVTGVPAPVVEGVMGGALTAVTPTGMGAGQYGFSRTGSLVYFAGTGTDQRTLVWVDRKGAIEPLGAPPRPYTRPSLSPDGRQVAVNIVSQLEDTWVYDIPRGTLTRLTFEGNNLRPRWMSGGKRIAFPSLRSGVRSLFSKLADGTGAEEQMTNEKLLANVGSISPDGKLAFVQLNPAGENDIGIIELQGERKTTVFLKTPFDEGQPTISPDGRWLAYLSNESGDPEVYVRAFPGPEGKWLISTEGGVAPMWARNGRELFYVSPARRLMAVDVDTEPSFHAGTPHVIFDREFQFISGTQAANYDVTPDGQRFLMIQGSDANLRQLNVVLNWFEELKRLVPTN